MDITPYIGYVVTAVITFITFYVATKNANNDKFAELKSQNAEQTAMISALKEQVITLKEQVEKHNGVIERTFKLESDMNTAYKRIDELKARDDKLEAKIEKFHG